MYNIVVDAASALVASVKRLRKRQYYIGEDYLSGIYQINYTGKLYFLIILIPQVLFLAAIEKELVHLYTIYQRNNSRIRNRKIIITAGEVKW